MSYDISTTNFDKLTGTFSSGVDVPLTLVAWVKKTAAQWADLSDNHIVQISETTSSQDNSVKIRASIAADRVLATQRSTSNADAQLQFTDGDYDDTWVVVVGVFTADNDRDVYIEDSTNTSNNTSNRPLTALLDEIAVGGSTASDFAGLEGKIAEVAIFDKALSTAEIDALQSGAETGPAPNTVASGDCIAYWSLDTDQATHADESGNGGPTLTVQSSAPFDSDHPTITGGDPVVNTTIIVPTGPPLS